MACACRKPQLETAFPAFSNLFRMIKIVCLYTYGTREYSFDHQENFIEYEIMVMIYRLSVLTIFLAQALGPLKQSETA